MGASSEAMLRTPSRRQKQNRGSGLATEWLWRMKEREEPSRLTGNTGPFRQNPQPISPSRLLRAQGPLDRTPSPPLQFSLQHWEQNGGPL